MIDTWGIGSFSLAAFEDRWIPWAELENSAWAGKRLSDGDPRRALRGALDRPGVYIVARTSGGRRPRGSPRAAHSAIVYVGESGNLRRRMRQFACSAGFLGGRRNGHSAGWRWEDSWSKDGAFFAFYPVPNEVLDTGLAPLWRMCREAQALATYAATQRLRLPVMNAKGANDVAIE